MPVFQHPGGGHRRADIQRQLGIPAEIHSRYWLKQTKQNLGEEISSAVELIFTQLGLITGEKRFGLANMAQWVKALTSPRAQVWFQDPTKKVKDQFLTVPLWPLHARCGVGPHRNEQNETCLKKSSSLSVIVCASTPALRNGGGDTEDHLVYRASSGQLRLHTESLSQKHKVEGNGKHSQRLVMSG